MQVILGTLLAALVPVVGFNAVMTSEHFASFLVRSFLLFLVVPSWLGCMIDDVFLHIAYLIKIFSKYHISLK